MANQRLQVQGVNPVGLQPKANPVDTFVRPTDGQELAQLARGLAEFSPSVQRFAGVLSERRNEEAFAEGEAAARKLFEEGKSLAEATRKGLIPKAANPWYRAGLQEQFGRVSADKWQTDLMAAVASDEYLQKTTKLEDFDKFVAEHRVKWAEENVAPGDRDAYFEKGFGHRADAYFANERRSFASRIENRLEKYSDDAHFEEIKRVVSHSLGKTSLQQIASSIDLLNKDVMAQGRTGGKVNFTAVKAIVAAAMESEDGGLQALELLKLVKGGSGVLGDTSYGSEAFIKAREAITENIWRTQQRDHAQAERARDERVRSTMSTAVETLLKDHHADLRPLMKNLADAPEALKQLTDLQRNASTMSFVTDETVKRDLFARIWTEESGPESVTPVTITRALNSGNLTTEDASFLMGQLKNASDTRHGDRKGIFDDFLFKEELRNLKGRFVDPMTGIIAGERADRVAYAEAMFREYWALWNKDPEFKNGSSEDKIKLLSDKATSIVQQMRGPEPLIINPAPPPAFISDEDMSLPKVLLLEEADLRSALAGRWTDAGKAQLKKLNLRRSSELGAFLHSQSLLFQQKYGRTPRTKREIQKQSEEPKE